MLVVKKENIVARPIHDSFFLIDISDNYSGDKCSIYEVNQTGMFIWNHIDGKRSIADLTGLLKAEIIDDIDFEIIYNDVFAFISTMIEMQFLEV